MPRKKLIRSSDFPYHVTARANNKERFSLPLPIFWKIITDELYFLTLMNDVKIHAFVLMPNHIHLLITVSSGDLGEVMRLFISALTKRVNARGLRSGRIFGGPYHWSIITSTLYYGHVIKYLYRNPVKAGLVEQVEEYEFSTASGTFGSNYLPLPISFTNIGLEINLPDPEKPELWLKWLNRPFPIEAEKIIQKSLRRREIKALINPANRRPYDELSQII
jgi:putative transposase